MNVAGPLAMRSGETKVDTLGIEPRASRMLSGCDTTTPCAHMLAPLDSDRAFSSTAGHSYICGGHHNIQTVWSRCFVRWATQGSRPFLAQGVDVVTCSLRAQNKTTEAALRGQAFALWLSMRIGIEPLGKKACVSAAAQLVP